MKSAQIIRIAKLFYVRASIWKVASLETDMAKRIMLSILPSFTGQGENYHTSGFPDYNALKLAVKGAERLIRYGTKACVDEMAHYGAPYLGSDDDDEEETDIDIRFPQRSHSKRGAAVQLYEAAEAQYNMGKFIDSLGMCCKGFDDADGWSHMFGGKRWSKIAKTLLSIAHTYAQLQSLNKRDLDKQVELMRNIVVEMNVFDGLAHNSGSIFDKMVYIEQEINATHSDEKWNDTTGVKIQRLMDAKELKNPVDVYKAIENSLQNSDERYMFKDWVRKIRHHPDYQTNPERAVDIHEEMQLIRLKKRLINLLEEPTEKLQTLIQIKNTLSVDQQMTDPVQQTLMGSISVLSQSAKYIHGVAAESKIVMPYNLNPIYNQSVLLSGIINNLWDNLYSRKGAVDTQTLQLLNNTITAWQQFDSLIRSI